MPTESDRPGEREHGPVRLLPTDAPDEKLDPGMALCLSGGGYRAMVFHLGALLRLNELGYLPKLERISSVSGGSITAAMLGLRWSALQFDPQTGVASNLKEKLVDPICGLAGRTIDAGAVIGGALLPGSIADRIEGAYRDRLFGDATLQDLPDKPRFVINATNVQSMALWRFSKPFMADYRVGVIRNPRVTVAKAVAASSAFPPVLSPVELDVDPAQFEPNSGLDLQREPYTSTVVLTDGGVYDNLGLETVWKRYRNVFVSDGGGKTPAEAEPKRDWTRHSVRVLLMIDNQVRSLRLRQIMDAFEKKDHKGAYWGIRTPIAEYELNDSLPCPVERTTELAAVPTRLRRLDREVQERLINWGYAVCDAAIRAYFNPSQPPATQFVYPMAKV